MKSKPLVVFVESGILTIKIGVNTLANAIACGNAFHRYDESKEDYIRDFAITDAEKFCHDIARELQREEEDGSTPLTRMLDSVAQAAIDDGSQAIDYSQSISFGGKSPKESW